MNVPDNFVIMPIPVDRFFDVCALLSGAATISIATATGSGNGRVNFDNFENDLKGAIGADQNGAADQSAPSAAAEASPAANDDSGEVDAHGHPWSADLHASTKGKTKDGLWRMKVGVSRPDPLPGFPKDDGATGTATETPTPSATSETAPVAAGAPADTDDDEFAAFRAAAEASNANEAAAAAAVPARQFSDADLGALCNQAAVKLGDPTPIKEIIARYVPEGQVAHSRNIPADKREAFASEVEEKAGIQFAG